MLKKINWKVLVVSGCIILFFAYIFKFYNHTIRKINLGALESYINSFGQWSILAFLVISTIRPLAVFIPVTILTLVAGRLYGPIYGAVLAMLSTVISSSVAFFISRKLGKSFVEKIIRKRAEKINLNIEKSGFKIIFVMRISGVFPLDIVSYAAGMTKVKYRDFILATILGSMLETISIAFMGHHINKPLSPGFILSLILVIVTAGVPLIYNKIKAGKKSVVISKDNHKK